MLYLDISFFLHTIVADQNQIICTLGIKGNLSFFLSFLVKRIPTYQCCGSNSNDFEMLPNYQVLVSTGTASLLL